MGGGYNAAKGLIRDITVFLLFCQRNILGLDFPGWLFQIDKTEFANLNEIG